MATTRSNVHFLGIETLCQIKQRTRWGKFIGTEGQRISMRLYVTDISMNLWGGELFHQWNSQLIIPAESDMNHK